MGIELKTNIHALVQKHGNATIEIAKERAIAKLQYLGELFIKEARDGGNYADRTGNLRSSIGYVVLYEGKIVKENINDKGSEGAKQTKKLAAKLKGENSEGFVLICMAGMEYALYVELHDYNVISGAEIAVRRLWKKMFHR